MSGIAKVGADVPLDVMLAAGGYAGHLPWDADAPTPRADTWLESSFAPWSRSILEQWAGGAFDRLDRVVFSRGEDSAQRLYYYVRDLQRRGELRGPEAVILDVARIPRATSAARNVEAVRALATQLDLDDAALERGIAGANAVRTARVETPSAGMICLLSGTAPPDARLHNAVAASGWTLAGQTHAQYVADAGPLVDEGTGDPAAAIGRATYAFARGARAFADPGEIVAVARRANARAVAIWLIEEEEALGWQLPMQRAALDAAGIPVLALTRRRWDARDGASDEIAAFLLGLPA